MLFALLFIFFIILNGTVTVEIAGVGVVVCGLAALLAVKVLGWNREKEKKLLRLIPDGFCYICLVVKEIIKANFDVMKIIFSRDLREMKPAIFTFDSGLKTELARTVLSDSITITPGTYTVKTDGPMLTVHRLGNGFAFTQEELCFARSLSKIEEKESARNA
ncbi:MAG: Na+/H+ antiporter subunit E [Eubacteriales bacterium]|nr:Na+/H+ antiporter subunit E [Eubacteriales bacterium]